MAAQATKFDNAVTVAGNLTVSGTTTGIETGTQSITLAADGFGSANLTYSNTYSSAPKPFFTISGVGAVDSTTFTLASSLATTGCRLSLFMPAQATSAVDVYYALLG